MSCIYCIYCMSCIYCRLTQCTVYMLNSKPKCTSQIVFLSNSTTIPLSNLLNLNPLEAVLNQSFYNVCLAKRILSGNPLFGPQNSQRKTHKTHKYSIESLLNLFIGSFTFNYMKLFVCHPLGLEV